MSPASVLSDLGVYGLIGRHLGSVEVVDLGVSESGHPGENLAGVLTEEGGVAVEGGRALDESPTHVALLVAVHLGVRQVDPKLPPEEVRVVVDVTGIEDPSGGDPIGL